MNPISIDNSAYDKSIELNENLDSPSELEGQPESGSINGHNDPAFITNP
ncbi:unnamed protein product, partial [Rotaria sp. Silwood2]